ncbi:zinc finger protein GIS-like [Andrographis paniculata]|uniref:zinc finger protein GIS-like n=1 Tax=Andrographis paniculata TaxID=175694 RepID=UPI0021E7B1DC|nr:zinc finger protein GIS-like [Andrographis paniculata]
MESSSSVLIDDQENNDDLGVGRSYECVFCKRGFNTAQALGGHMNIHRKDRRNNKTTAATNPTKHEKPLRLPSPDYANYSPLPPAPPPAARQFSQPPAAGDWRRSFEFGTREGLEEGMNQKQELDLELRLGYGYS